MTVASYDPYVAKILKTRSSHCYIEPAKLASQYKLAKPTPRRTFTGAAVEKLLDVQITLNAGQIASKRAALFNQERTDFDHRPTYQPYIPGTVYNEHTPVSDIALFNPTGDEAEEFAINFDPAEKSTFPPRFCTWSDFVWCVIFSRGGRPEVFMRICPWDCGVLGLVDIRPNAGEPGVVYGDQGEVYYAVALGHTYLFGDHAVSPLLPPRLTHWEFPSKQRQRRKFDNDRSTFIKRSSIQPVFRTTPQHRLTRTKVSSNLKSDPDMAGTKGKGVAKPAKRQNPLTKPSEEEEGDIFEVPGSAPPKDALKRSKGVAVPSNNSKTETARSKERKKSSSPEPESSAMGAARFESSFKPATEPRQDAEDEPATPRMEPPKKRKEERSPRSGSSKKVRRESSSAPKSRNEPKSEAAAPKKQGAAKRFSTSQVQGWLKGLTKNIKAKGTEKRDKTENQEIQNSFWKAQVDLAAEYGLVVAKLQSIENLLPYILMTAQAETADQATAMTPDLITHLAGMATYEYPEGIFANLNVSFQAEQSYNTSLEFHSVMGADAFKAATGIEPPPIDESGAKDRESGASIGEESVSTKE